MRSFAALTVCAHYPDLIFLKFDRISRGPVAAMSSGHRPRVRGSPHRDGSQDPDCSDFWYSFILLLTERPLSLRIWCLRHPVGPRTDGTASSSLIRICPTSTLLDFRTPQKRLQSPARRLRTSDGINLLATVEIAIANQDAVPKRLNKADASLGPAPACMPRKNKTPRPVERPLRGNGHN